MGDITVNKSSGRVLSFNRGYDYYMRVGSKMKQQGRYIDAVRNFRIARQKKPSSSEAAFALSETLCALDRYDESNALLFEQFINGNVSEICFFGIALNYMFQKQYQNAEKWATIYLNKFPDGEYSYDAQDMLNLIDSEREAAEDYESNYSEEESFTITRELSKASRHTSKGNTDAAIAVLEKLCDKFPDLTLLQLNLALTYFCAKDFDKAISTVKEILDDTPDDVPAKCCLALFLSASGRQEESREAVKVLKNLRSVEPTDMIRIATTLMDMKLYEDARDVYMRLLEYFPYVPIINHGMAVCQYELGNYEQAAERYELLLKLDPSDTIASYYIKLCRSDDVERPNVSLPHLYQVPYPEILSRIDRLKLLTESEEKIGPESAELLNWALTTLDDHMKGISLQIIATYGGDAAEDILRRFILRQSESFEIKAAALKTLESIGAKKPYGMLTDSADIITAFAFSPEKPKLPAAYRRIGDRLSASLMVGDGDDIKREALNIFYTFVKKTNESGHFPQLTPQMEDAVTAAIEFLALNKQNGGTEPSALLEAYGVTERRLDNALNRIADALALPDKPEGEEEK